MEVLSRGTSTYRRAALFALAGEGLLCLLDACIKTVSAGYPTFQIAFLRFACGSLIAVPLYLLFAPGRPPIEALRTHGMRALLSAVTSVLFFFGLSVLPLAEAIAISFLSPLFTALLGAWLLGEIIDRRILIALFGGFAGMMLIVGGQFEATAFDARVLLGMFAVGASAVFYALFFVLLRARASVDPIVTILMFQNVGPAVLLCAPAVWTWTPMASTDLMIMGATGLLGVTAHALMALAYRQATAAQLAPLQYAALVWGILFGFVFFSALPKLETLAGAVVIAISVWIVQAKAR